MSAAVEFNEYPMMMVHPAFQPARNGVSADERRGLPEIKGTPVKFPPVTVHDEKQRAYHEAQGYRQSGNSNVEAFFAAHAVPPDASAPQGFAEYPKMVRSEALERERVVGSEEEEEAVRAEFAEAEREAARAAEAEAARLAAQANQPAPQERMDRLEAMLAAQAAQMQQFMDLMTAPKPEPKRRGTE